MKTTKQLIELKNIASWLITKTQEDIVKSFGDRNLDTIHLSKLLETLGAKLSQLDFVIKRMDETDDYNIIALKEELKEDLEAVHDDLSSDREYSEKAIIIMKAEASVLKKILGE